MHGMLNKSFAYCIYLAFGCFQHRATSITQADHTDAALRATWLLQLSFFTCFNCVMVATEAEVYSCIHWILSNQLASHLTTAGTCWSDYLELGQRLAKSAVDLVLTVITSHRGLLYV
jgi:hypothetical protein